MQPIIIKNRQVRLEHKPVQCTGESTVELLEDEGVVRAIQLRCACGAATVVELEYDQKPSDPEGESS